MVIDARPSEIFCDGFVDESLSVPFNENFVAALQELVEDGQRVLIVADEKEIVPVAKALNYSGSAEVAGVLAGGFETWSANEKKIDMLITIDIDEFIIDYNFDEFFLIDVRTAEEFEQEHVEDSQNIALNDLEQLLIDLETSDNYYLYANTFSEAVTAGSIFKRNGFERVRVVMADYEALKKSKLPFFKKKKEKPDSKFSNN